MIIRKKQTKKYKNKSMDIYYKVFNKVVNTNNLNNLNLSYILNLLINNKNY